MEPVRQTLRLAWGDVSYLEWRPRADTSRPPVLLLHGGGFDNAWLSWGGVGPALAEAGHHVIAPDHPGYGESPLASWSVTQERLVAYVAEVVDALRLDRYVVGGISLGGGLTVGHVLQRPERVAGALLFGSYGFMDRQFDAWYGVPAHVLQWAMLRTGLLGVVMRTYGGNRRLMESSLRQIVRTPANLTPDLVDEVMRAAEQGQGLVAFEQWQRDQFLWNRLRTSYAAELSRFLRPALVVNGDHDTGVPVARARAAAEAIPDARLLVVPGAGHWVQRDRPDIVVPAMLDFLDSLDERR